MAYCNSNSRTLLNVYTCMCGQGLIDKPLVWCIMLWVFAACMYTHTDNPTHTHSHTHNPTRTYTNHTHTHSRIYVPAAVHAKHTIHGVSTAGAAVMEAVDINSHQN